jgi:sugar phosphate isomerase/epimerase
MIIGTTSFGFRYQLLDAAVAPPLERIVEQAADLRLEALQICENARPLEMSEARWTRLVESATALGVQIGLGCKTTDPEVFERYLARAAALSRPMLRLVFEEEQGAPPAREGVERFLEYAARRLEGASVPLAIENHFDVPSRMLAEAVAQYPAELIGFCVDTANSLRNFESPENVFELLGPRALCYHVKDFKVEGHQLGFAVSGAPLGTGRLDLDGILARILSRHRKPEIYVENWVPQTGNLEIDIAADEDWLRRSLLRLRQAIVDKSTSETLKH